MADAVASAWLYCSGWQAESVPGRGYDFCPVDGHLGQKESVVQPATKDLWIPWPVLYWEREAKRERVMPWDERERHTGKGPDDCCCLAALQGAQP